jgi:choline monooxygenase
MSSRLTQLMDPFDPELPLERARTIPSAWYTDPEIYAAECRAVFGTAWQVVGRVDQVAEPGAFLTTEIAGEPILVVRDAEGVLRAFYNVCRHRAAPVMSELAGKATRLRCRYHGWTYDLSGHLRGLPEFEGVSDFRREDYGLVPIAVDRWGPNVWVRQNEAGAPSSLAQFLAPLPERVRGLGLEDLRFVERRDYVLECNWKVFVDNYLDGGYHVNTIHPALAGVLDYSRYRTEVLGNTSVQTSPLRPANPVADPLSTAVVRTSENAYYWWVFPNFMMNIYDGLMDTNLVLPLGPSCCRVVFDFYFARTEGAEAERFIAQSIAVAHQVQMEDGTICEEVQRGLGSRSFDTGRFSVRRERGGYHFHCLLARYLRNAAGASECKARPT